MPHDDWSPNLMEPYPSRPTPLGPPGMVDGLPSSAPSPEQLEALVELGLIDPQLAENLRQQQSAEAAAESPLPEGRQVSGTFVAPSPLEHLAALAGRAGGAYRRSKLEKEREDILGRAKKGYGTAFDVWLQAREQEDLPPFEF